MATVTRNEIGNLAVRFKDGLTVEFKQPTDLVLAQALARTQRDPNGSADVLIDQCLVKGDKSLLKGRVAYLRQLQEASSEIFGEQSCTLSWTEGLASVEFLDGKMCVLNPATREVYGEAQAKSKQNPINYIRHIMTACWHSGDEDIQKSPGHLLGLTAVLNDFLDETGNKLGN